MDYVYFEKVGGMDILRAAIEKVSKRVSEDEWLHVIVNILFIIDYYLFKWCILLENNLILNIKFFLIKNQKNN